MPKSTLSLLILIAFVLVAGGYFLRQKHKEEDAEPAVWWEFTSEVGVAANEMMINPGSWAIHVHKKTKFSVYLIDNGEKTLKEAFVFDPTYLNEFFVTTTVDNSGDQGMVRFQPTTKPGTVKEGTPEEMRQSRWVNFPKPFRMGYNISCGYTSSDLSKSGEQMLFFIYIEETKEAVPYVKSRIEDMIDESKKQAPMSYLVITCSAG